MLPTSPQGEARAETDSRSYWFRLNREDDALVSKVALELEMALRRSRVMPRSVARRIAVERAQAEAMAADTRPAEHLNACRERARQAAWEKPNILIPLAHK